MRAARIFLLFFAIIQNIVIYASSIHILLTSMFCHHRISFMQLGHLFTRSGLTYSEVSHQRSAMIPSASWAVVFHYPG